MITFLSASIGHLNASNEEIANAKKKYFQIRNFLGIKFLN